MVKLGIFVVPDAADASSTVAQVLAAERAGLDLGAYGPRMLRLTGRLADGWLPSLEGRYLSPEDVPERQAAIDAAAREAGRQPEQIDRAVNVMGLDGDPGAWAEQLVRVTGEFGFSTLLVNVQGEDQVEIGRRLGEDIAPRVRELLE